MKGIRIIGIVCLIAASAVPVRAQVPAAVTGSSVRVAAGNGLAEQTAVLYRVLGLIDQNLIDEASALFETVPKTDKVSPMREYLSARLAIARESYTEALQHLAQVTIVYSRDPEWAPAALFFEGLVYKRTGHPEAARQVAEDLLLGWPESVWNRRAGELK